ncbi:hypothetical protein D3C81_1343970 [compost metagenome]
MHLSGERELRRFHSRVMHTRDGNAHRYRSAQAHQRDLRGFMAQPEGQPQRRK